MARLDNAALSAIIARIRDHFPVSGLATKIGVKLHRAGNEWKGRCPLHNERSPSFTIYADDRRWICFGCNTQGDVLDLAQIAYGLNLPDAIKALDGGALRDLEQQQAPAKPKADTRAAAHRIVEQSAAIEGTPAEAYLRSRGITMALPHTLRFARLVPPGASGLLEANGRKRLPALIAIATDANGTICGLQRSYLTEAGRKAASSDGKVKFSLWSVVGGAIQLGPPAASIVVCEGLEDGLTLAQGLGRSVWVSAGTSFLPRMILPDEVRSVVIGADNDAAGEKGARLAAAAFLATGRSVRIMRPNAPHKDFNAELQAQSSEAEA